MPGSKISGRSLEKYADIIFANADEARSFTGLDPESALEQISEISRKIAVVKTGAAGSWIRRGEEKNRSKHASVELKDTTGAGDLYASGFLYGYARGEEPRTVRPVRFNPCWSCHLYRRGKHG
jgi:sugar/nucleoside kinase (ribokinase family)